MTPVIETDKRVAMLATVGGIGAVVALLWAAGEGNGLSLAINVKSAKTLWEALRSSERVDLRGFGSFVVKDRKERQGRNPRTGETITIAAKRDASFKPGKELTERLAQVQTGARHKSERSGNPSLLSVVFEAAVEATAT
jgi:nucleoid DNA-binding protein